MGRQIIKQPNGKYCVFSSVVDNIIMYDATEKDIVKFLAKESIERIKEDVKNTIGALNNCEKPYGQFTMNYKEMLNFISDVHGKKEEVKVKNLIEKG